MLKDLASKYYLEKGYNCAQAVLLAANEYYKLGVREKQAKFVVAFGGGMGCGKLCGALAGAMSALGLIYDSKAPDFRDICSDMVEDFEEVLGDINCAELIGKYKTENEKCLKTVELCLEVLQKVVDNHVVVDTKVLCPT